MKRMSKRKVSDSPPVLGHVHDPFFRGPIEKSPLEVELSRIVESVLQSRETSVTTEDIKYIVQQLMPDLDALIANKVKQHFLEIGNFLVEKFKIKE